MMMNRQNACRYLTVLLFSLLIMFAGAGVAVIHCYCVSCQLTHECCEDAHNHGHVAQQTPYGQNATADSGQEECCTSTVYKINLLKGADKTLVVAPLVLQLCKGATALLMPPPTTTLQASAYIYPPSPPEPRRYLALYSVFII